MAVDRLLGILSLVAMGVVGLLAWTPADGARLADARGGRRARWRVCLGAFWADRLVRALLPAHLHDGPLAAPLLRVSDAVSRYRGRGGVLAHVMVWSLVVQLLRIAQAYLLGLGLGLAVPFRYYLSSCRSAC